MAGLGFLGFVVSIGGRGVREEVNQRGIAERGRTLGCVSGCNDL